MGNESSNTRQHMHPPATLIKPILRKPNVYPMNYMAEPFYYYYPADSVEYNESETMTVNKPVEKTKEHHNHHRRHHHHHHDRHRPQHSHKHRIDRACQTTPSLLLGPDGIVEKPRYTPTFLRDSSTASESSVEEYPSASVVIPSAQMPHSAIKVDQSTSAIAVKPSASVVVKKAIIPKNTDNQQSSAMIIRSTVLPSTATDPKNIPQPHSSKTSNTTTTKKPS